MVMTADAPDQVDRSATDEGAWMVGIDGSECSLHALDWALANAPGRADDLELVSAWQSPLGGAMSMTVPLPVVDADSAAREAAANELASLAADVATRIDLPVTAVLGRGGPAEVLLEASTRASLLVVGSRGRGGFARLLLGSTSTQCATHASRPTVVVPGDVAPRRAERILVGVDGSANSMKALRWAIRFAVPGSTLVVASVFDATPLTVGADAFFFPDASDLASERFDHLVESVADDVAAADIVVEREFVRGAPRPALVSLAETADLVVVGARGHGAIGAALLGSVSTWLLHHADRPIVVVPPWFT